MKNVRFSKAGASLICWSWLLAIGFGVFLQQNPVLAQDQPDALLNALKQIMDTQVKDWNDADIDGFMEAYWKSEKLTFSSGGNTTRGWQKTLDRYKTRYSTPEKMGELTFTDLELQTLGDSAALMLGRWHLERKDTNLSGNFSLVWKKIDGSWKIIHDHTSTLETIDEDGNTKPEEGVQSIND